MAEQEEGRLKFSTLAILIGSGVAIASTNQPSPPKLAISAARIEHDVCVTNTTHVYPDGPNGDLDWTYIDAVRRFTLRIDGRQSGLDIPTFHCEWLMMRNHSLGTWSYFVGSGKTNVFPFPTNRMVIPASAPQAGLKNVPQPPTPK